MREKDTCALMLIALEGIFERAHETQMAQTFILNAGSTVSLFY